MRGVLSHTRLQTTPSCKESCASARHPVSEIYETPLRRILHNADNESPPSSPTNQWHSRNTRGGLCVYINHLNKLPIRRQILQASFDRVGNTVGLGEIHRWHAAVAFQWTTARLGLPSYLHIIRDAFAMKHMSAPQRFNGPSCG